MEKKDEEDVFPFSYLEKKAVKCGQDAVLKCRLCAKSKLPTTGINLGDRYNIRGLGAHYFCVLLSTGAKRSGTKENGMLGFCQEDVMNILKTSVVCSFCKGEAASIHCHTCKLPFHLPCGIRNGAKFTKALQTFCAAHDPTQIATPSKSGSGVLEVRTEEDSKEPNMLPSKTEPEILKEKDSIYDCGECGGQFTSADSLKFHLLTHVKHFKCSECGSAFQTSGNLERHIRVHRGEKPHKCDFEGCLAAFAQSGNLKQHRLTHASYEGDTCPVGGHKCPVDGCGAVFRKLKALGRHQRQHQGQRAYTCPYEGCGAVFKYSSSYKTHQVTHTKEKRYQCDFEGCNARFSFPGNAQRHRLTHSGVKPYVCDVPGCHHAFTQKGNLKYHKMIHDGIKPFQCSFAGCSAAFVALAYLKKHLVTHNGKCHVKRSKLSKMVC